jgi:hypothetical protein
MSEPNSASDPTPEVPKAPSFTYGSPAATPGTPDEQLAPPAYGERVPAAAPVSGVPVYGAPVAAPGRRRRTWDLVLTVILLVVGFFGMLFGILAGAAFTDPAFAEAFEQGLSQQGISGSVDFGGFATIVIVSHVLLYLVALGVSIPLLVTKRIAFWVPLAAGVIAAIVFWGGYFAIVFSSVDLTQFSR